VHTYKNNVNSSVDARISSHIKLEHVITSLFGCTNGEMHVDSFSDVRGTESFSSADHQSVCKAVTAEIKSHRTDKQDSILSSILVDLDCDTRRTILQGKERGQWLSVMPSKQWH
jgi:hypothetical protein